MAIVNRSIKKLDLYLIPFGRQLAVNGTMEKFVKSLFLKVSAFSILISLPVHAVEASEDAYTVQMESVKAWADADLTKVSDSSHATQALLQKEKSPNCALIMHGLHESPAYMNGLSQFYYSRGFNVISLRLPGHQESNPQNIDSVKAESWIQAGEQAFNKCLLVGEKVELVGYSTGGTVATYLALAHPKHTKRLVLMAPALALAKKVLYSTLGLQFGSLNSQSFCRSPQDDSVVCQTFKSSDAQLAPMIREGLVSSPAAGFQVQRLIVLTLEKFFKRSLVPTARKSYQNMLLDVYLQLQVPLIMINSELDSVVDWKFNQEVVRKFFNAEKKDLLFPESDNISHIHINKPYGMGFKNSINIYNHRFDDILKLISAP